MTPPAETASTVPADAAVVDPAEIRITIDDIRAAGFCVSGARTWFQNYRLDFRDFLRNGISAADFLATGDGQAEQVYRRKLEREALNG